MQRSHVSSATLLLLCACLPTPLDPITTAMTASDGEEASLGAGSSDPASASATGAPTSVATSDPGTPTTTGEAENSSSDPFTTGAASANTTSEVSVAGTSGTGEPPEPDTTTDDTGTPPVRMACAAEGSQIDAHLVHGDLDPGCGTVEFVGQSLGKSGSVYELDGCPCESACESPDPWTLTLDLPPEFSVPVFLPDCARIVVQRTIGEQGCELLGVSIWKGDGSDPRGDFHAGSLLGPIDALADIWSIEALPVETCACEDCCDDATRLDLRFTLEDVGSATVPEGEGDSIFADPVTYSIFNFQSHVSGECDTSPDIDWLMFGSIGLLTDGPDISARP